MYYSVIFPVCFNFVSIEFVSQLWPYHDLLAKLFVHERSIVHRIILVLTGACLFVMSRKSCLKFSYARSESESLRHSWKGQVLKSAKKAFSSKVL